jgi:ribose transport system substrate-binding protein
MKRATIGLLFVLLALVLTSCAGTPTPTPTPTPPPPTPTTAPTAVRSPTTAPTAVSSPTTAPVATSPTAPPAAAKKFTIAVVPPALVSPYFITLTEAAKASAAKNKDIELIVQSPSAETKIEEQVKIVEDLIQKKVNLIAISTANWDALTAPLKKAREAGIEVVGIDRVIPLPGVDMVSMLGVDEIKGGETVGEYVVKVLNSKGNVAILEGVTGDYWSERRTKGFHNIVDKVPGIKVVSTQPANWERAAGMSTAENILQANKDLDLIWGLNDNMALGALQAVEAAKLSDKIKVVGYNADKEAKEAVKAGRLNATVAQQPAKIAQTIVEDIAPKLMAGKRSEIQPVIYIPTVLVTKENVDSFLP